MIEKRNVAPAQPSSESHSIFLRLRNACLNVLHRRTISVLVLILVISVASLLLYIDHLQSNLVSLSALKYAETYTQTLKEFRKIYTSDVIARLDSENVKVTHDFENIPGAIPLPATLSMKFGERIAKTNDGIESHLYSPLPFPWRKESGGLKDNFARDAWEFLSKNKDKPFYRFENYKGRLSMRYATSDILQTSCVDCHNSYPGTPKNDWKVGDLRGIIEIDYPTQAIVEQTNANLKGVFAMVIVLSTIGLLSLGVVVSNLRRNSIELENRVEERTAELSQTMHKLEESLSETRTAQHDIKTKKEQLELLAAKLAKYLSPQVYKSIFSGKKEVKIETYRKKLTIFFSDIKGFTELTDSMESEALSTLLNNYLNEMSEIAIRHGGTIDKFIGDAILIFFGDPESLGVKEDALACAKMAIEMRDRMNFLQKKWENDGIYESLKIRCGINTGYCTVGNFGSEDRLDYTIIGGSVNLASRFESSAEPDEILISHETFSLIKDEVVCKKMDKIKVKGIAYPVQSYQVLNFQGKSALREQFINEQHVGFELLIDFKKTEKATAIERLQTILDEIG